MYTGRSSICGYSDRRGSNGRRIARVLDANRSCGGLRDFACTTSVPELVRVDRICPRDLRPTLPDKEGDPCSNGDGQLALFYCKLACAKEDGLDQYHLPRSRLEAAETNAWPKEFGIIAELPFHATCRIKEPMNQPAQDSKDKRERFKQLAHTEKLRTGRAFAADVRRSNIHPSVHKLTTWRKRNRLSQRAAVAVLQKYYFHITFASLRSWEEGRRSPHPHTSAILEKFLNDHPTVPPPK
jgi:DNA-binding transcriptional regulator YiaG